MPALDFPPSTGLAVGTPYTGAGITWTWDGAKWTANSSIALDDLSDVIIDGNAAGNVLIYDGANWQDEPDVNGGSY